MPVVLGKIQVHYILISDIQAPMQSIHTAVPFMHIQTSLLYAQTPDRSVVNCIFRSGI